MNKNIVALFVLLLSFGIHAETFQIGGELLEFQNHGGLLLKGCEKTCLALKTVAQFKKIDLKKERRKSNFKSSSGSEVCRLVYHAEALLGITEGRDQRAFCVFKDNSLIEINSLSLYLLEKKIVSE